MALAGTALTLSQCELFKEFSETGLAIIATISEERAVPTGVPLFVEGMASDALFVVKAGRVRILIKEADGTDRGDLRPGPRRGAGPTRADTDDGYPPGHGRCGRERRSRGDPLARLSEAPGPEAAGVPQADDGDLRAAGQAALPEPRDAARRGQGQAGSQAGAKGLSDRQSALRQPAAALLEGVQPEVHRAEQVVVNRTANHGGLFAVRRLAAHARLHDDHWGVGRRLSHGNRPVAGRR